MLHGRSILRHALPAAGIVALAAICGLYALAANTALTGLTYSGTLKNNGVASTGTNDFKFDLVDASNATLGCATDVRNALPVTNGRFDVANLFGACGSLET